jgi:hypothetical protein
MKASGNFPRLVMASALAILAAAALLNYPRPHGSKGPRFAFATRTADLGDVVGRQTARCDFRFRNIGDRTLVLSNVSATCGCTIAGGWPELVPPGKTGRIPVTYRAGASDGPFSKAIRVSSNDREEPQIALRILGNVKTPIEVAPSTAIIDVVTGIPQDAETIVTVRNRASEPLALSSPESKDAALTAELAAVKPGETYRLTIRAHYPASALHGRITLLTSATNMPRIEIPVYVMEQPVLSVMPSVLLLAPNTGETTRYTVSIRNNGVKPLKLATPTANFPGIELGVQQAGDGRSFVLNVLAPSGLRITNHVAPEISVPIEGSEWPAIRIPVLATGPAPQVQLPSQ